SGERGSQESGSGDCGADGSAAGGRRLRERLPLVGGWLSRGAEPGEREGAPMDSKRGAKADSKTGHKAYGQQAPITAPTPDQPVPHQGKDQDARSAEYDEDAPYEGSDQDIPHVEYDHDTTFEPYDHPPVEPSPQPPAEQSQKQSPES
ncbi:hypothetical protein, partial [Streptomyces sp. T21Q-yed]